MQEMFFSLKHFSYFPRNKLNAKSAGYKGISINNDTQYREREGR